MAIEKIRASRVNTINSDQYAGNVGLIWYDPTLGDLRIYANGEPGGMLITGGGNGSPGGANGQVQFNHNGVFGGSANLTFDKTTGALTAVSFAGDGGTLSNIAGANVVGEVSNATYASSAVNAVTAETVSSSEQPNITGVGTLSVLNVSGNITGGNLELKTAQIRLASGATEQNISIRPDGGISSTGIDIPNNATANTIDLAINNSLGNVKIQTGLDGWLFGLDNNLTAPGNITTTANISGGYILGNGSQLTGISAGSSNRIFNGSSNVEIATANGAATITVDGTRTWTFDTAGALSLAGNVVTTANLIIKADNNNAWISQAAGDGGFSQLYWTSDIANADPYDGNGDFAWAYVDSGGFFITSRTVEPDRTYNWDFRGSDGALITPGKFITPPGDTEAIFDFHAPGFGDSSSHLEFGASAPGSQYFVASVNDPSGQAMTFELTAVDEGNIEAQIRAQRGPDTLTWTFDGNGDLILPGNSAYIGSQASQVNIYSDINTETAGITIQSGFSTNIFNEAVVNITTNAGDVPHQWQFDQTGNLTIPGSITCSGYNNPELLIANADSNWAYGFASDDNVNYYTQVKFYGDNSATRGFKILDVNSSNAWVFDGQGVVTLPGEGVIRSINDTVALQSLNTTTGNANSVYLGTSGGLGFNDGEIGGNWLEIFRTGAEPEIRVPVGRGNLNIQTAEGENSYNWKFGKDGTTTFPGNVVFPDATVQTTAYPGTANTLSLIGNITGNYILGNGSQLTGLPATYGNSNVAANLAAFGSNPISTTGNITAGYFIGNGSALSSIAGANVTGTVANATYATSAGSATTAATVTTNAQPNITSVGTLTSVSVTGNTTSGNLLTGGLISATGNINGNNLISTGAVYSNYNTNTANTGSFMATGGNTLGGTGYLDYMVVRNTSGGATNPYKWFRVNPTGGIEIINSAYSATVFSLSDAGVMNVPSPYQVAGKQAVNGPAFSAYPTSPAQTITSGSQQRANMGNEVYDIGGCYDAPNGRFTPNVEGYYQFEGTVRIDGSSGTGEYMITVWKNGAEYKRGTNGSGTEIGASFFPMQVSCQAYANGSTDYFELYVQQGSGSNRTISVFQQISYFQGMMIRGA